MGEQNQLDIAAASGGFKRTVYFTSSGNYSVPSDVARIRVTVVGAGGGGGGCATANYVGGGGGSGATIIKIFEASEIGATETVTVGLGGAGGVGASNGVSGGTSSFGAHITATGGIRGRTTGGVTAAGESGGVFSGTFPYLGFNGDYGHPRGLYTEVPMIAAKSALSGGGEAFPPMNATAVGGLNTFQKGNGGIGGRSTGSGANGANGADGIVIIEEFY